MFSFVIHPEYDDSDKKYIIRVTSGLLCNFLPAMIALAVNLVTFINALRSIHYFVKRKMKMYTLKRFL